MGKSLLTTLFSMIRIYSYYDQHLSISIINRYQPLSISNHQESLSKSLFSHYQSSMSSLSKAIINNQINQSTLSNIIHYESAGLPGSIPHDGETLDPQPHIIIVTRVENPVSA